MKDLDLVVRRKNCILILKRKNYALVLMRKDYNPIVTIKDYSLIVIAKKFSPVADVSVRSCTVDQLEFELVEVTRRISSPHLLPRISR